MKVTGNLKKMSAKLAHQVHYTLDLNETLVDMNSLVGERISIAFDGVINCPQCEKKVNKLYQGFCYDCFTDSPSASECILKPELCEAHLGKGRDIEWEENYHNKPHYVYLALTSALKVGVTRDTQVPTRWIDQGAWRVIKLAKTPHRRLAGEIEVALKQHLTDKTPWQAMLKNETLDGLDLMSEKNRIAALLPEEYKQYVCDENEVWQFNYPVFSYPEKIKSLKLDKENYIEGICMGVRGQYLMFDDNRVINIRSHAGYQVDIEVLS
ncbi:MAG: hypothetical protein ACJAUV_001054 [Flavobacteriales bacterium]|jgi:hypothetical protein